MKGHKKTFPNGVRLLTVPMRDNPTLTVMTLSTVGSNNEKRNEQGLAHFLEHMILKGSRKYPTAYDISSFFDALGVEFNAFTGAEFTGYYAKGHPKHFKAMLDVISDLYLRPGLRSEDLEKERGVIIEEINMYDDLPMAKAGEVLDQLMYGDQPAGRSILGTKDTIRAIDQTAMKRFHLKNYTAGNTIVVVSGKLPTGGVARPVEEIFGYLPQATTRRRTRPKVIQKRPALKIESRSTDQAHLRFGFRAFEAKDRRLPALLVLNAILGGGASSRLFQKLREEMGVCYYVGSKVREHDTYGSLIISAGVDAGRALEVVKVITAELDRLRRQEVAKKELKKAKDYLTGRMLLELETSTGVADFYLDQEILKGNLETPDQWSKKIKAVTASDLKRVAGNIFSESKLNLAIVGKIKDEKSIKKALKFD